jgi:hypothetical protein
MRFLEERQTRSWIGDMEPKVSKVAFTKYISRYLHRPPFADNHLISFDGDKVVFSTKDTRNKRRVLVSLTTLEFFNRWEHHIPDRYRHSVHYFGLFSPRSINTRLQLLFHRLGQVKRKRPPRLRSAGSIRSSFGRDPLLTKSGERLYRVGLILPNKTDLAP